MMRVRIARTPLLLILAVVVVACGGRHVVVEEDANVPDTGRDADADTDVDIDHDAGVDGDIEVESDADTDRDGGGRDADRDRDADFDGDDVVDADLDESEDAVIDADAERAPVCFPTCPLGTECRHLDAFGWPECVLPTGELGCATSDHCPDDGFCSDNRCRRWCGCVDGSCSPGDTCVTEDRGCGICMHSRDYECEDAEDCRLVIDVSICCNCPKTRNAAGLEADDCIFEYPYTGPIPAECEPECERVDHCWPCREEPGTPECDYLGVCRMPR